MTCFIAQNLLSELVDDELDPVRQGELQTHLAGCQSCSHELAQLRRMRTMVRSLPVERAPRDLLSKVRARVERKSLLERAMEAVTGLRMPSLAISGGLATAAVAFLAITIFLKNGGAKLSTLHSAPGADAGAPVEREVDLADKSQLAAPPPPPQAPAGNAAGSGVADNLEAARAGGAVAGQMPVAAPAPTVVATGTFDARRDAHLVAPPTTTLSAAHAAPEPRAKVAMAPPADQQDAKQEKKKNDGNKEPAQPGLYYSAPGAGGGGVAAGPQTVAQSNEPAFAPDRSGYGAGTRGASSGVAAPDSAKGKPGTAPAKDLDGESAAAEEDVSRSTSSSSGSSAGDEGGRAGGEDDFAAPVATRIASANDTKAAKTEAKPAPQTPSAADATTTAAVSKADVGGSTAPATTPTPAPIGARFEADADAAPQAVVDAARAAGGRIVSPAAGDRPPALARSGASTVVIVDLPVSAVPAFEEKLKASGSFEVSTDLPSSGRVRLRVEVVRK